MENFLEYIFLHNLKELFHFFFYITLILFFIFTGVYVVVSITSDDCEDTVGEKGYKFIKISFIITLILFTMVTSIYFLLPSKEQLEIYYNITYDNNVTL